MAFLDFLKPQKCVICHGRPERAQLYYDDQGQKVKVCYKCVPYAERRAFRKK